MIALVVLLSIIALYAVIYLIKCRRLPPGPYGLPIVGYYPFLGKKPSKTVTDLSYKYGDVMSMNILGKTYWFLNSIDAVDEVYNKQGDLFHGRNQHEFNFYSLLSSNVSGVLEGEEWKTARRITMSALATLGMGKTEFDERIHENVDRVEAYIDSKKGQPNDFFEILPNLTTNVLATIVFSKQYDLHDPDYIAMTATLQNTLAAWTYMNFILTGFGFELMHKINPKYVKMAQDNKLEFRKYINRLIDERMKTFNPNQLNDLLDYFIKEMDGPNADLFNRNAISGKLMEIMYGGTVSSAATLYHSIHLMVTHPEIQEKVHNEINEHFGKERLVNYIDREMLPYTLAVVHEVHRYIILDPFIDPHFNREETTYRGYHVPKKTPFIANVYAIFKDPKCWKNPEEFDPHNFLDDNGKFLPNRALIPFGTGTRNCMGYKLAETELFIAFTRMMQRWKWIVCDMEAALNAVVDEGHLRTLKPFKVRAVRR